MRFLIFWCSQFACLFEQIKMKRDRSARKAHDFEAFVRQALGARRGEAPYELMCEWKAAFLTDDYTETHGWFPCIKESGSGGSGFTMCSPDGFVLARADYGCPLVTFHHYIQHPRVYKGWRDPEKWRPREPRSFAELPTDIWFYFIRLLCEHNQRATVMRLLSWPVSKQWFAMCTGPRFASIWKEMAVQATCGREEEGVSSVFSLISRWRWLMRFEHGLLREATHGSLEECLRSMMRQIVFKVLGDGIQQALFDIGSWSVIRRGTMEMEHHTNAWAIWTNRVYIRIKERFGRLVAVKVNFYACRLARLKSADDIFEFLTRPIELPFLK